MGQQLREGQIIWYQDLANTVLTTVYPSGLTAGVPIPSVGRTASRVHIGVDYTVASGTLSVTIPIYGLTTVPGAGGTVSNTWLSTSTWVYLGSLNAGASITANGGTWNQATSRITFAEVFSVSGENYSRIATRNYAAGGTTPVVSTYIGFVMD
jgi:hypothetical protein